MVIKAWQVGGHVRDMLLGIKSKDIDYAVEAPDYESMVAWIEAQGATIFLQQPEYWTVRALIPGKLPSDYVLCRKDGQYSDGRRPDTVMVGTLADDLARRDFTVNAIAYEEETGVIFDPHNGQHDLRHGELRCVGSAIERFEEDALRLLRAIRFAITKGFRLNMNIIQCLHMPYLTKKLQTHVSEERIREELLKCFHHDTFRTLDFLYQYPLIKNACFQGRIWLLPTVRA